MPPIATATELGCFAKNWHLSKQGRGPEGTSAIRLVCWVSARCRHGRSRPWCWCGVAVFGGVLVFGDVLVFGGYCIRTQPGPASAPFRRPKVHIGRLTCTHPLPCYHVWRTVTIFLPTTSHVNAHAAEVHRENPSENPSKNYTCPKIRGGFFCPAGREGGGPRPPVAFGQFQVPLHTHRPSAPFGKSKIWHSLVRRAG